MKTSDKTHRQKTKAGGRRAAAVADWRWADPKGLKVDPVLRRLIPLQSRGEYLALGESIKTEGCRDPLLVWKGRGVVLDGHTRRDLCIEHKKRVKVHEVELADERAAVEYVLRIQRQRRNLTREAMSYFRGADYNAVKQRRGGRRPAREAKARFDPLPTTAGRLALKYGVSDKTIKRDAVFAKAVDRIVLDYGDPEVRRTLLGGDARLTPAAVKALPAGPAEGRKAAVDALILEGGMTRKQADPSSRRPRDVAQSLLARLRAKGEVHARSVVLRMAKLLGLEVAENTSAG